MQWPSQSPDLNQTEHAEDQTEGKMAQEQAGAEDRCSSRASPGMKTKTIFVNTCLILKQIN